MRRDEDEADEEGEENISTHAPRVRRDEGTEGDRTEINQFLLTRLV